MYVCELIEEYQDKSSNYELLQNEKITDLDFPKKYGVYIISDTDKNVIYIGKGGSVINNGDFKKQNISKRLKNIRNGKKANDYFIDMMNEHEYSKIYIDCIETDEYKLPAFLEAILMQKYFEKEHKLPQLNKTF